MKEKFLTALAVGIVIFKYTKKSDGTERYAVGTTKQDYIPQLGEDKVAKLVEKSNAVALAHRTRDGVGALEAMEDLNNFLTAEPKKSSKTPNPDMISYYDFGAKGWRTFDFNNFIGATTPDSITFDKAE